MRVHRPNVAVLHGLRPEVRQRRLLHDARDSEADVIWYTGEDDLWSARLGWRQFFGTHNQCRNWLLEARRLQAQRAWEETG